VRLIANGGNSVIVAVAVSFAASMALNSIVCVEEIDEGAV
jgi:hypothetical protein